MREAWITRLPMIFGCLAASLVQFGVGRSRPEVGPLDRMAHGQSVECGAHWRQNRYAAAGNVGLGRQDELYLVQLLRLLSTKAM